MKITLRSKRKLIQKVWFSYSGPAFFHPTLVHGLYLLNVTLRNRYMLAPNKNYNSYTFLYHYVTIKYTQSVRSSLWLLFIKLSFRRIVAAMLRERRRLRGNRAAATESASVLRSRHGSRRREERRSRSSHLRDGADARRSGLRVIIVVVVVVVNNPISSQCIIVSTGQFALTRLVVTGGRPLKTCIGWQHFLFLESRLIHCIGHRTQTNTLYVPFVCFSVCIMWQLCCLCVCVLYYI